MMFTKIRFYVLMGIAAVVLAASVNHVNAEPPPIAVVIVTDRSDSAMMKKYDQIVGIIEQVREVNKLQTRDLRIITYDYNDAVHRKYCNGILGIYKRELLCVGISPLLGPSLKTGKMLFKLPLVTKPVDDVISVMKYARIFVPGLKKIEVLNAKFETTMKRDPTTGISVTIPDPWVFTEDTLDRIFDMQRGDNEDIEGVINYLPLDKPQTAREHAEELLGMKQYGTESAIHYSEVSDTTLAGLPAATFTETGSPRTLIEVVAVKDNKCLELTLWAPNELLASVQDEFDSIKNSVRF